jgi:hypothetical protein
MEHTEFNIYATGLNKQYWYLTLVRCNNLLLADAVLFKKWNEATYDDGSGLKKLITKVEVANNYINLNIEETTLAYSAINILHQHFNLDNSANNYEGCLPTAENLPYLAQWHVFALNAFEDLYFNEDLSTFVGPIVNANLILGKKEVRYCLN